MMEHRDESVATFHIGHWTDTDARTGCTVVMFDRLVDTAFDARGGAPGTRETDLLRSSASVRSVDAIVLSGGSAPGLSAADGVVRYLRERGRGFPTSAGSIPIVPAAIIFDLAVGEPRSPDAGSGYAACRALVDPDRVERGAVGAGTGARIRTIHPDGRSRQGGFGAARVDTAAGRVWAFFVVNAAGEVVDSDADDDIRLDLLDLRMPDDRRESTTIGVVVTDAAVDHRTLERMTISAHDGMARMIRPCHTAVDGDAVFTCGLRRGPVDVMRSVGLCLAAELATERAIADAVAHR